MCLSYLADIVHQKRSFILIIEENREFYLHFFTGSKVKDIRIEFPYVQIFFKDSEDYCQYNFSAGKKYRKTIVGFASCEDFEFYKQSEGDEENPKDMFNCTLC